MDTLVNFPWGLLGRFVGIVLAIFYSLLALIVASIAVIAWVFYPANLRDADEEKDPPSFSLTLAKFYVFIILLLSAVLAVFRSYFPDWHFAFWSSFAALWCLGNYFASEVLQWKLRNLIRKAGSPIGRLKKARI